MTYASFGDTGGFPVIHCHGSAESRFFEVDPDWTAQRGVRVITPDRPGFGGSDPVRGRTLLRWVSDVEDLAQVLGIDRFALFGWSGGGAHALACAHRIASRLTSVAIFGSVGPVSEIPGLSEALLPNFRIVAEGAQSDLAGTVALVADAAKQWVDDPESFVVEADLPASDLAVYQHPVWGENLKAQIREGLARTDGIAWDAGAVYGPWGFAVSQIASPVSIWHGDDDTVCPPLIGRWLADAIPEAQLRALPGAGHFAVYPYWHNVVDELLATAAVPGTQAG